MSNAIDKTTKKFFHLYEGPYAISRRVGNNAFVLVNISDGRKEEFELWRAESSVEGPGIEVEILGRVRFFCLEGRVVFLFVLTGSVVELARGSQRESRRPKRRSHDA